QTVTHNTNADGNAVTITTTGVTQVSINADGKIDKNNVTQTVYVHSEVNDGQGNITSSNATASATIGFSGISKELNNAASSVAQYKSDNGVSLLQAAADGINV